ncbi:MAG: ureidoglycolate lyase [Bacteroidota bacterium]|nr:ureidoglycolate lyase [Bacteroidota bacterium]
MKIKSEHINESNFNKYGKVVLFPKGEPTSKAIDYKFWSDISNFSIQGETEIGICRVYKQPETKISTMERHLNTQEILIPIDAPFKLPLMLPEEEGGNNIKSFEVGLGEVVIIDKAVWHGACIPVGKEESSYFVIFRRNTPKEDIEKKSIQTIELV